LSATKTILAIGLLGALFSSAFPSAARASCVAPPRTANLGTVRSAPPLTSASIDLIAPSPSVVQVDSSRGERRDEDHSIVGLWHVRFLVDGNVFDEAFDAWESGGTEVLNDAQASATGNVCLGVWRQTGVRTFHVTHPGWNFDLNGTLTGSFVARERVTLARDGRTYAGSIVFEFYDVSGTLIDRLTGEVRAERVLAE